MKRSSIIPITRPLCSDETQQENINSREYLKAYVELANKIISRLAHENFDQTSNSGVP